MNALKNKLDNHKVQPSVNGWDKLSGALDTHQKVKPKNRFTMYYYSAAAAVLLLIGFLFLPNEFNAVDTIINNKPKYVEQEIIQPDQVLEKKTIQSDKTLIMYKALPVIASVSKASEKQQVKQQSQITLPQKADVLKDSNHTIDVTSLNQTDIVETYVNDTDYLASLNASAKISQTMPYKIDAQQLLNEAETELDEAHKNKTFAKLQKGLKQVKTLIANRNFEQ